ncbi:MAG: 3-phosphoshikimate 1-carboxyvinyltransferase [Fluviicola sp. XM-24bin1]|nr:MAG: 3-phosphoshikimate 1-carboxyvinyltransferase [Fluviicola sp. XM-24bin1]
MTQFILPFSYQGSLQVPYSKSYLQRAIAIGLLYKKDVEITGFTPGNDAIAARSIAENLGAKTAIIGNILNLTSGNNQGDSVAINCGESGLSTRMFSPISASLFEQVTIEGEGSILMRPMDMVIDALEKLGARVDSNDGKLPLNITGKIQSGTIEIDGSESSQLLTGLLIALSFLPDDSTIHVQNLKSIPYVQMTLDILDSFGVKVTHEDFQTFRIPAYTSDFDSKNESLAYTVEGDWSGASFHVVGSALSGEIALTGLNPKSAQADKAIVDAVRLAGASVEWKEDVLHVKEGEKKAFEFDATHCPDLFPPLAALAAGCEGTSTFIGVSRLASKESNRGLTIQSEMKKLGIEVELDGDVMRVTGGQVQAGTIDSNNDHRIAMMGAILATQTDAEIEITNPNAVNKSYPAFFEDLAAIATLEV